MPTEAYALCTSEHVTEKGYRLSLITPDIQQVIYTAIIAKCQKLGCTVITVGGIEYHIHLLSCCGI